MAPTTAAELEGMTYREIQSLCKEAGVKASGKKNELVARLLRYASRVTHGSPGGGCCGTNGSIDPSIDRSID